MQTIIEALLSITPFEQFHTTNVGFEVDLTNVLSGFYNSITNYFSPENTDIVINSVTPINPVPPLPVPMEQVIPPDLVSLNELLLGAGRAIVTTPYDIVHALNDNFISRFFYALPPQLSSMLMLCMETVYPHRFFFYYPAQGLGVNHFPVCSLPVYNTSYYLACQLSCDQMAQVVANYPCFIEEALVWQDLLFPSVPHIEMAEAVDLNDDQLLIQNLAL